MSKRYRLVVFDWEGTISDTLGQIIDYVASEARRLNLGEMDPELAREHVSLGLVNATKKVFPHLSPPQLEQLLEAVQLKLYARHAEVYLIPGVLELIQRLSKEGVFLAIATNKGQQSLHKALQSTGLEKYFTVTKSAGVLPSKPHPEMLVEILRDFGVTPEDTLMIGDSPTDMEMAKSLEVDVIGVDFYHQHPELLEQSGALAVFDDYKLVADFLQLPQKD
ncbi:hydrolase [Legionella birminghamensis]|uniref:Hydrolase n=1 Tax=Legionella birminghamensis TaxID=28083 RepID=A0A378ICT2_9GAMM|nr:HAD-IA family hydrolase [Legionella birminghamensis]KTC74317.1 hydrolase [Legionella birminghamensis]STX32565.1 hydrolase (haloacid dehalogenase family) [Legionella birminghamensis]